MPKHDSIKRQQRADRKVVQKRTEHGKCIRQEYGEQRPVRRAQWQGSMLVGYTANVGTVRYYHVTKGWRTRQA